MSYNPTTDTNPNGTALSAGERATRHDGWTLERQQLFIDHLAEHGRVTEAAEAAGMSVQSAYKLRARVKGFAFGWRAAMTLAYDRLREIALDRASNGVRIPRYHDGKVAGVTVRHSDRLLLGLLAHLKPVGEINFASGHRDAAIEPAAMWAAAVDAYAKAYEDGGDPVAPTFDGVEIKPVMTRAEFLAAIAPWRDLDKDKSDDAGPDAIAEEDAGGHDFAGAGPREETSRGSPLVSPL